MPNQDGTGPRGQGPGTGRKMGPCFDGVRKVVRPNGEYGVGRGFGLGRGRGLGRRNNRGL